MKNIVWLASYPKSGNTWVRAFLTCLCNRSTENVLTGLVGEIAAKRSIFEEELCLESSEMTEEEIRYYRPLAIRAYAGSINTSPFFMKVHDAYPGGTGNDSLFPSEISRGVIYIVRNPLDVAISYANHNNIDIDRAITEMNNEKHFLGSSDTQIKSQLPQKLFSWSTHVRSWTSQSNLPILCIRYEDMVKNAFASFKRISVFSGLTYSDDEIMQAVERSSFDKLKQYEDKYGFKEKPVNAISFFRKGKVNSWKEELSKKQITQLISDHFDVMVRFDYIDREGNVLL